MKKIISLLLCFLFITSCCVVLAEEPETPPEENFTYETVEDVLAAAEQLGAEELQILRSYTSNKHYYAGSNNDVDHADLLDSDNETYCHMDIQSLASGAKATNVQSLYTANGVDVAKGDIMFFAFQIRANSTNHSTGYVIGSGNYRMTTSSKYNASVSFKLPVSTEWVWCYRVAKASYAHAANEKARIDFILGYAEQSVDIKNVTLINFKNLVSLDDFQKKENAYEGMEEGAEWREAANARIEQIRKSDVRVKVINANGDPVEGAQVSVEQQKHSFRFGTYMPPRRIMEDSSTTSAKKKQNAAFQNQLKTMFNTTGFENIFKPGNINNPGNEETIQTIIDFAEENDMSLRGHTLVWREGDAKKTMTDEELAAYESGDAATKKEIMVTAIRRHIDTYTKKYGAYIDSWDVVNEFLNHKDEIYTIIGKDMNEVAEWFKIAGENTKATKPNLVLNDFGIISYDETAQDSHYELAKQLKELGAPITTIGMQAHLGSAVPPAYVVEILNKFQDLGMDIEITEFTYENSNETVQANYVRDFLTAVFSHPSTSSMYLWGFAKHEIGDRQNSALCYEYNASTQGYKLKPSGEAWMDLIYNRWWTDEEGSTNEHGVYDTRAFHGDHTVTVTVDGEAKEFPIELGATSKQFTFNFDEGTFSEETAAFDEKGLRISLDSEHEKITVEGNVNFAGGSDATILVTDSDGNLVYFNQVPRMATDGSFTINTGMSSFLETDNQYTVKIGSQGRNSVTFWLAGNASMYDYQIKSLNLKTASGTLGSFEDIQPTDTVTAEVKLATNSQQTVFAALYNENGKLLKANKAAGTQTGDNEWSCTTSLSMEGTTDGAYIKLFVWNGETLQPFTEAYLFD